jgi:hypothetical protein
MLREDLLVDSEIERQMKLPEFHPMMIIRGLQIQMKLLTKNIDEFLKQFLINLVIYLANEVLLLELLVRMVKMVLMDNQLSLYIDFYHL